MKTRFLPATVAVVLFLAMGAAPASADSITFDLNNTGVLGGPYVEVDVTTPGTGTNTTATVKFTALGKAAMIDSQVFDLNVNGTTFSVPSTSGFATGPCGQGNFTWPCIDYNSANSVDGFGLFNLQISQHDGASDAVSSLTVNLLGSWTAGAAGVLFTNSDGSRAAAHVIVNSCTFYVGDGRTKSPASCAAVPEPSSLLLLGSGLIGLGLWGRKRFRKLAN